MSKLEDQYWKCQQGNWHVHGNSCNPNYSDFGCNGISDVLARQMSGIDDRTGIKLDMKEVGKAIHNSDNIAVRQPILAVIDEKLGLEALNDNIIVKEDEFKTGYECPTCDGKGHTQVVCKHCNGTRIETVDDRCQVCDGKGKTTNLFRPVQHGIETPELKTCNNCGGSGKDPDFAKRNLQPGLYPCRKCICRNAQKDSAQSSGFEPCSTCKGMGATVVIPEDSVRRPNSGIVVSTGDKCCRLKAGDRVLYSNHTGLAITFKRNVVFRWMREDEVPIQMHGVGELHKHLD